MLEANLAGVLPHDTVDSKMVRDAKYPGLMLGSPIVDYVGLARSQGVEGEAVDVSVAREGIGAESTWDQEWEL